MSFPFVWIGLLSGVVSRLLSGEYGNFMILALSNTAYPEEIQHFCAVQLPKYKEGIWSGILSHSFRYLQLNLFLWATFVAEEKQETVVPRSLFIWP